MSKVFCFIPAKSNSNRLTNKNNLLLNGKPLFYFPIKCAIESKIFSSKDIIFSSDSDTMNTLASSYGANVPFKRPKRLTNDEIGINQVLLDFLEHQPVYKSYDYVFISLPTSPFSHPDDYSKSFKIIKKVKSPTLLSVSKLSNSIFQSMMIKERILEPIFPETYDKKMINSFYDSFHPNGCIHIIKIKALLKHQNYVVSPIAAYEMDPIRGIDIDEEIDFRFAEFLVQKKLIDLSWI